MLRIYPVETNEDLETVKKLFVEYANCLEFDLDFQNFDAELANLPSCYATPDGCILLAEYDRKIAGCVGLRKLSDGICEMKRLYVKQEFRGLKIGKALSEAIVNRGREMGYNYMRLDFVRPRVAESLYRALGFKEIAPYENVPLKGTVFMELTLV